MIQIPNRDTKTITQNNKSSILGDFWSSFNIDLRRNKGVISVSPRLKLNTNSTLTSNFGLPVAARHFDGQVFMIAGTRIFKATGKVPFLTFTEDASTGAKTTYDSRYSDMEFFNGQLFATTNDELMSKVANTSGTGAWTEEDSTFADPSEPHMLAYLKKYDRLYYSDGDFIASIDTNGDISSGSYEIDLETAATEVITCMKATSSEIFIGTIRQGLSLGDLHGSVYRWDGFSAQVSDRYELSTLGAMAMAIKDNVPYIIDARGALLKFTGYSFEEIDRLPRSKILPYNFSTEGSERWIHPNGFIATEDGTFLLNINNLLDDSGGSILENVPSGVWEWSEENGFVHKQSPSYTVDTTITDYGQNRIAAAGMIVNMNGQSSSATRNGQYLIGATYYTNATSTLHGLFYDDSNDVLRKTGYFVTPWVLSRALQDTWQMISVQFREFLASTDKIILKYRTRQLDPVYATITWNDTSSFHTSTDMTGKEGYEVEILQGVGSGKTFHITTISGFSPWKVNLDEEFTGATGTAKARIQNWAKIDTLSLQEVEAESRSTGAASTRVQVKCVMEFTGEGEVYELALLNEAHEVLT